MMMLKKIFLLWFLMLFNLVVSAQVDPRNSNVIEESIDFKHKKKENLNIDHIIDVSIDVDIQLEIESGIVPVKSNKVKISIQNNFHKDIWYVFPGLDEQKLSNKSRFFIQEDIEMPFLCKIYSVEDQQAKELIFLSDANNTFRAFKIKAGAMLTLRNYDIGAFKRGDRIPFWSALSLKVDGVKDVSEWFRETLISSPDIEVLDASSENKNTKLLTSIEQWNKAHFSFVSIDVLKKYKISIGEQK